jgi:hypothetical protein
MLTFIYYSLRDGALIDMHVKRTERATKLICRKLRKQLAETNLGLARQMWGDLNPLVLQNLATYSAEFGFSIAAGDLLYLDRGWYVTHTGLIRLARKRRCVGIDVKPVAEFSDYRASRWAFQATVFRSLKCRGFVGYGDADPSNVSSLVRGSEMRVAETRAVNRALRKAYGIGICSVEEIGTGPSAVEKFPPRNANDNGNGPKVRDRLCQLIRQHKLDPELVKAYAIDFCGTKTLREASREQVENFVQQLAAWAEKDRNALLCQLNSYARPKQEEVA